VAAQIADYHAQTHPAVGEHFVQPILLGGELAHKLLTLAHNHSN